MDIETLLQAGYKNTLAINKTRTLTQQLEVKTDIFVSLIFIAVAIFIVIVIILHKNILGFRK